MIVSLLAGLLAGAAGAEPPAGNDARSAVVCVRAAQGPLTHQIPVGDIVFFHADDKYTVVQTASAEYLIRTPIQELVAQLDGQRFWQVHRSTIVNLEHVAGTRRDELSRLFVRVRGTPGGETELPVSRAYVHLFKPM